MESFKNNPQKFIEQVSIIQHQMRLFVVGGIKYHKIDTPLGTYNSDWTVLIEVDGKEKFYFVVETKSTLFTEALRRTENAKIVCGKEHFKALGNDVEFAVTNAFEDFSGKYV